MKIPNIELGQKVRCTVTGFIGIAIARYEFLNGCIQIAVKPKVNSKGEMQEAVGIDIEQLEVVGAKKKTVKSNTGGVKEIARSAFEVPKI